MQIKHALLSVSDKTGLVELASALAAGGAVLYATGGTAAALVQGGLQVEEVSTLTGSGELLGGRVKTLHPHLHAGILADRDNPEHMRQLADANLPKIDLVVVNFYPFEQSVAANATPQQVIENIDIGGPAMVRAAAKNHGSTAVLTDPADYPLFIGSIKSGSGIDAALRARLATKAFVQVAHLDAAIANHFSQSEEAASGGKHPAHRFLHLHKTAELAYGENPHQPGACYRIGGQGGGGFTQLHGAALSYNNLLDAHSACWALGHYGDRAPAVVIVKHNNPCGIAVAETAAAALERAQQADPLSAFGGVVAFNRPLDEEAALALQHSFWEVVLAPQFSEEAKSILAVKDRLRLLLPPAASAAPPLHYASIGGLMLTQQADSMEEDGSEQVVSRRAPSEEEWRDLRFAWRAAAAVKSNAIVLAREQTTIGIGAGQMSRVDSTRIACEKAQRAKHSTAGSVAASDGFFPFADSIKLLAAAGVRAVVQPGGSKNDEKVIAAADAADMALVTTGRRHFRH